MDAQVMLLAAGFGSRLWPLTADRAKPSVPFMGVPLIRRMALWLRGLGFERMVVNTHYQDHSIRSALDGLAGLQFSHEETILGTAGGLAWATQNGLLRKDLDTLVVNAKLVANLDVKRALQVHREKSAEVTMILRPNQARESFTTVRWDPESQLVQGFGPPRVPEGENPHLYTGMQWIAPSTLTCLKAEFSDTVWDVYPPLLKNDQIVGVSDEGRWSEFSTLERYLDLHLDETEVFVHPDAVIEDGAQLHRSVLWKARVDSGAFLDRCIVCDGVHLPAGHYQRRVFFRSDLLQTVPKGKTVPEVHGPVASVPLSS